VSGDVVKIHYTGIMDRGLILWFAGEGCIDLLTPKGLDLTTEVSLRNTGREAKYREIKPRSLSIDIKKHLRETDIKWGNGELIDVELKLPCDTSVLLSFPLGETGKKTVYQDYIETTIEIRKKAEFRDIVIENYEFRRSMRGLLPLESVTITKNDCGNSSVRTDLVYTESCSLPISAVNLNTEGRLVKKIEGTGPHWQTRESEIYIPLSFTEPHDKYIIEFRTRKS
jgi:hypothetical protein